MAGPNDSIESIRKMGKISDFAIGDDEYHTDVEIKRLDQYSPELNRLNKEEIRDIQNRPNIYVDASPSGRLNILDAHDRLNGANMSAFSGDQ